MSLGDFTKCDLSAGVAKIDRGELINVLEIAVFMLSQDLNSRFITTTYSPGLKSREVLDKFARDIIVEGRQIQNRVDRLIKACELLHTISDSTTREEIIFED
jgi:hypothetical protein